MLTVVHCVNNCAQAITSPFLITDEAFLEEVRLAGHFVMCSALTRKETKKPFVLILS